MSTRKLDVCLFIVAAGMLAPGAAVAAPDLVARLTSDGLQSLGEAVPLLAPRQFTLDKVEKKISSCPIGSDAKLKVNSTQVNVDWIDSAITNDAGQLRIDIVTNLDAKADAEASACSFIDVDCEVRVRSDKARLTASFVPQVQQGVVRLVNPQINIDIAEGRTDIHVDDCGLTGSILNLVIDLMKEKIVSKGRQFLTDFAQDELPALLEDALADLTPYSAEFDGRYRVDATLTAIDLAGGGLGVDVTLASSALSQAPCVPGPPDAAPQEPTTTQAPAFDVAGSQVALAVSVGALAGALRAAWLSGLLCVTYDAAGDTGSKVLSMAAVLLKMQSIDQVTIVASRPPVLTPVVGEGASFELSLPGLQVTISGTDNDGPAQIALEATLVGQAQVLIDRDLGALTIEIGSAALQDAKPLGDGGPLPDEVLTTLDTALGTLLTLQLSQLQLVSQAMVLGSDEHSQLYLYFDRIVGDAWYVYLYGGMFALDRNDQLPPETSFVEPLPTVVRPEDRSIVATGHDDQTPTPLLSYAWRIDGGEWREPTGDPRLKLAGLADGDHTAEVVAVDLNGNRDATAAVATFAIDSTLPPAPPPVSPPVQPPDDEGGTEVPAEDGQVQVSGGCTLGHTGADLPPLVTLLLAPMLLLWRRRSR